MKKKMWLLLVSFFCHMTLNSQTTQKSYTFSNQQQYLLPYLNVLNYNIKNDGNKDQADLIQLIIDKQIPKGMSEGKVIFFPSGIYKISKKLKIKNGITIMGEGQSATIFICTTEQAGFSLMGKNQSLKNLKITTQNEDKNTVAIDVYGDNSKIQEVTISGAFEKGIYIHADNKYENTYSFNTKINDIEIRDIKSVAIEMEHCIDTYLSLISIYNKRNDTNAISLLVNTGTSGLYVNRVVCGFGKHSLKVQHSLQPYGTNRFPGWKAAPIYLFFDQFVGDTNTGGDAILFDTTLSNNTISCIFNNCWAAYAGKMENGCTVNPDANGLHIQGGSGISFIGGRIRLNCGNGILISSEQVKYIKIQNNLITSNNVANKYANGITINAPASNIDISNNTIGNILDSGGNQQYGVSVTNKVEFLSIIGNDLLKNNRIPIFSTTPFDVVTFGNKPITPNPNQTDSVKINKSIYSSRTTILPQSKIELSLIRSGLIILRNIDNGKSAVFLIGSNGGTTFIAGDSSFVAGKTYMNNQIGIITTESETSIFNSYADKQSIAYSLFLVDISL